MVKYVSKNVKYSNSFGNSDPVGPCTDDEKIKTKMMRGLNWDRNKYPKAE